MLEIEQKGLEISRQNYIKAAITIAAITEHITNIPLPHETFEQWKIGMHLLRIGDDKLDKIADSHQRLQFIQGVMKFMRDEVDVVPGENDPIFEDAMHRVRTVGRSVPEVQKEALFDIFAEILETTEMIRHVKTAGDYSFFTRREGELTMKLFIGLLPSEYTTSQSYVRLERSLIGMARFANSLDTFIDMSGDYKNGETQIPPTLKNRAVVFLKSTPDAVHAMSNMRPSRALLRQISLRTKETLQNNPRKTD